MSKQLIEPWRTGMSAPPASARFNLGRIATVRPFASRIVPCPRTSPASVEPPKPKIPRAPALHPSPVLSPRAPLQPLPVSSPIRHRPQKRRRSGPDPGTLRPIAAMRFQHSLDDPKSARNAKEGRSPKCEGGKVETQESATVERQQASGAVTLPSRFDIKTFCCPGGVWHYGGLQGGVQIACFSLSTLEGPHNLKPCNDLGPTTGDAGQCQLRNRIR